MGAASRLKRPWRLASGSPHKKEPSRSAFIGNADLYRVHASIHRW